MDTGVFINFSKEDMAFIEQVKQDKLTGRPELVLNLYHFAVYHENLEGFTFELLLAPTDQRGRFEIQNIRKIEGKLEELSVENETLVWQMPRTRYAVPQGEYEPDYFIRTLGEKRRPLRREPEPLFITTVQESRNILVSNPPFQAVLRTIGFNINQNLPAGEFQVDEEKARKVRQQLQDFSLVEGQDFVQHWDKRTGYFYMLTNDKAVEKYMFCLQRVLASQPRVPSGRDSTSKGV